MIRSLFISDGERSSAKREERAIRKRRSSASNQGPSYHSYVYHNYIQACQTYINLLIYRTPQIVNFRKFIKTYLWKIASKQGYADTFITTATSFCDRALLYLTSYRYSLSHDFARRQWAHQHRHQPSLNKYWWWCVSEKWFYMSWRLCKCGKLG